ncbi:MAG: Lrp/AsnC family transcriptional regulator [Deltaproteobacteria bacterium]|nr:Lrp/AsnC family transcriptional regulator [Deltaproteobacteria bacterium]
MEAHLLDKKDLFELDEIDKKILNRIQGDFPILENPYDEIGREAGISSDDALERVKSLLRKKVIRKVGPFFDARKMGYRSTLCAVNVPSERLEQAASAINGFVEVTHNYLRQGNPNIWFTVIAESKEAIASILKDISTRTGVGPIHNLPAEKMFKVKVDLKITD